MRLILSLLFICSVLCTATAQFTNSVFLNKKKISFLDSSIEDLNTTIAVIAESHDKNDTEVMAKQKSKILGLLNRLESNCSIMVAKIQSDKKVRESRKKYEIDNKDYPDYFNRRNVKDQKLEHLKIDETELSSLEQYANELTGALKKIKGNQKDFFPGEANAEVNLAIANEMMSQAQNFSELINSKIVSQ